MIQITNRYRSPITAFVVTVDLTTDGAALTQIYYDLYSENYPDGETITQSRPMRIPLPHALGVALPTPILRSAVFADGTTWGDQAWANELLLRRKILLDGLHEVTGILHNISEWKTSRASALATLGEARQLRADEAVGEPFERQQLRDRALYLATKNLAGQLRVNGEVPDAAVAAYYMGRFLEDWHTYLQSAKPSPAGWSPDSPPALDSVRHRNPRREDGLLLRTLYRLDDDPPMFRRAVLPNCSPAQPAQYIVSGPDNCGTTTWELVASVSGQKFDEGARQAFGLCYGGFYDCQDSWHALNHVDATVDIRPVPNPPPHTVGFFWYIDSWFKQDSGCSCNDPNPDGTDEVKYDSYFPTTNYYVSCQ